MERLQLIRARECSVILREQIIRGNDSLSVQVSDGSLTDSVVINLTITVVNDAPVISEANATLNLSLTEDGTFAYDLNASDVDGDTLSWTLSSAASNGTASINSGTGVLSYSPGTNYSGNDSLTVQVSDGSLTDLVGINLSVIPFNDVPSSISLSHSSFKEEQEAGTIVGTFSTVDVDLNDTHSYSLISGIGSGNNLFSMDSNGTLRTATVFDYESNASSFSITVRVMDGQNASLDGNFSISLLNDESDDPANPSPESVVLLSDGISVSAGWKQAGWFGYYFAQSYPWVYHGSLGWVYVSESNTTGTWLYRDSLGWLWTNPSLFPYIFRNTASGWLYLDTSHGPLRYYDYSVPGWLVVE
ncbi:MAG: Ig-like domain-containing protein [Opitutales bacterium]